MNLYYYCTHTIYVNKHYISSLTLFFAHQEAADVEMAKNATADENIARYSRIHGHGQRLAKETAAAAMVNINDY